MGIVPTVVDGLTEILREAILSGELAPGDKVQIQDLVERFEVSHIPLREALRRLEGEGLVVYRPRRTSIIAPLRLDELHDIYSLRLAIEPAFAQRAVELGDQEWRSELVEFMDRWKASQPIESESDQTSRHQTFHLLVLRPALSQTSERILTQLWSSSRRYIGYEFGQVASQDLVISAHEALLTTVLDGDGIQLRRDIEDHLRRTIEVLDPLLSTEDIASDGIGSGTR